MKPFEVFPFVFLGAGLLFILMIVLVNMLFLALEIELPNPLKFALPGMITSLIMLVVINFL
ncbi:hypothetical protein DX932_31345 [Bacillus cereus]|uniref:Uncharacterized protein n=1 Tax=Bacillus cereus TaxID=1396 RepID=A0A9W7PZ52_BACCE|nr:hypothetical protein [Bacillus cereus]KAA6448312.1 hypothetical protein DX932_31345 [Bacillus cereus]